MAAQPTVRVITLDSMPVVHAGVGQLLAPFPDLAVTGHAYSLEEAIQLGVSFRPDVALVEIRDLGIDWPEALSSLARAVPDLTLIVFTATVEVDTLREALRAGARGYLLKNADMLALAQALRTAAAGGTAFAPEAMDAAMALHRASEPRAAILSLREREVLTLLVQGLSNDEIATQLHVSTSTVKYHCRTIFQKLHVATRGQAMAKAYAEGLVRLLGSERERVHHDQMVPTVVLGLQRQRRSPGDGGRP